MGQEDILNILKKKNEPLTRGEITQLVDSMLMNAAAIGSAINKLVKYGEIEFLNMDRLLAKKFYGCKHSIRLYYIPK